MRMTGAWYVARGILTASASFRHRRLALSPEKPRTQQDYDLWHALHDRMSEIMGLNRLRKQA